MQIVKSNETHVLCMTQYKEKNGSMTQYKEKNGSMTQYKEKNGSMTQYKEKNGSMTQYKEKNGSNFLQYKYSSLIQGVHPVL